LLVFLDAEQLATLRHDVRVAVDRLIRACDDIIDQGLLNFICHVCMANMQVESRPDLVPLADLRALLGRYSGIEMSGTQWAAMPPSQIHDVLNDMGHASSEVEVQNTVAQMSVWPGVGFYYMNLWVQERALTERAQRSFVKMDGDQKTRSWKDRSFWRGWVRRAHG
jgi:hypothetical protein